MNDEQIIKEERWTAFPKTIEAINRLYNRNKRRMGKNTKQKENKKEGKKRYGKSRTESRTNKEEFTKRRKNRGNKGGGRNRRQRTRNFREKGGGPRNQMVRRHSYTLGSRQFAGRNSESFRVFDLENNKKIRNGRNLVNSIRRVGFSTPMPFIQPYSKSTKSDGCVITGSEFIGSVVANTTQHPSAPTNPGDILKILFLNPMFLPGSRLKQLAQLYKHYKFIECVLEFVPNVSNFQPGSIGMAYVYDPSEPINLIVGADARMKHFMTLLNSNLFKVSDYGRVFLQQNEDTLKDYFIHPNDEARTEMQAYFVLMSFSTFPPFEVGDTTLTLGELVMHYKIKLDVRDLEIPVPTILSGTSGFAGTLNTGAIKVFNSITLNTAITIPFTQYGSIFAMKPSYVAVFTFMQKLTDLTTPSTFLVDGAEGNAIPLFSEGSIWYGYVISNNGDMYITTDLDRAIDRGSNDAVTWNSVGGALATDSLASLLVYEIYDIGENV